MRICSPVITAAPVLATLAQVLADGTSDVAGCVDATQVADVIRQWHANGNVGWKLPLLQRIIEGPFSGKRSEPWEPGSLHNFMHAKVVVADDVVFLGSFNLSHSGEKNAENVLEIRDAALAGPLSAYVDEVRARYPALSTTARPASELFPLDRRRRLRGDVERDAVDRRDLVDDPRSRSSPAGRRAGAPSPRSWRRRS